MEDSQVAETRRQKGERSRNAILGEAARLATVEGLEGLSIARLAQAVGMSKSGLFAHFGSKEELQLATIDTAEAIFDELVVAPAQAAETAAERLRILIDRYLHYIEGDVFPGGCFFTSALAEMDTRPGPVRDRLVGFLEAWLTRLEETIQEAQAAGALDPDEDARDLTFEIEAALVLANAQFAATHNPDSVRRARRIIERRLAAATPA